MARDLVIVVEFLGEDKYLPGGLSIGGKLLVRRWNYRCSPTIIHGTHIFPVHNLCTSSHFHTVAYWRVLFAY